MGALIFGIIVIIIGIYINYLISKEFKKAAELKGYMEKRYFWITFFLSVVGMLLIIALPDLKNRELLEGQKNALNNKEGASTYSLPEI